MHSPRSLCVAHICAISILSFSQCAGAATIGPPLVDKYFTPNVITAGQVGTLSIHVQNPNLLDGLTNVVVNDSLPPCVALIGASPQYDPPGCNVLTDAHNALAFDPSPQGIHFLLSYMPAQSECTLIVKVFAVTSGLCVNTTDAPQSDQGPGNAALASLTVFDASTSTWNGQISTSWMNNSNWNGNVGPGNGSNVVIPANSMNTNMVNDTSVSTFNGIIINTGGPGISGSTLNLTAGIRFNLGGGTALVSAPVTATNDLVVESDSGFGFITGGMNLSGNNAYFTGTGSVIVGSAVSGVGNVGKSGTGTLTVQTQPSYTGTVTLMEGGMTSTVAISQPISVMGSGFFSGGAGPYNTFTISDHGVIRPFNTTPNTWTVSGNVTFSGGGAMASDVASNGIVYGRILGTGNVTLTGAVGQVNFGAMPKNGDSFELISTPGTVSDCFSALYCNESDVELRAECTDHSASAVVVATDVVHSDSFDGCPPNLQVCGYPCQSFGGCH